MDSAVTVSLTTAITGEDTVTAVYDGLLRVTGDTARITYTEADESGARTSTLILLSPTRLEILRRGAVSFHAVHSEGHTHTAEYRIGGMCLDATVVTESLTVPAATRLPAADCTYRLTLGGEERCFRLCLRLAPRGGRP